MNEAIQTEQSQVLRNQDKPKLSNGQTAEELTARLPNPGPGRPKLTVEQKLMKKAVKDYIKEHIESLAEALPAISPVLIDQATKGNILAIKEIHDRVMGKPITPIIAQVEHSIYDEIQIEE